jgi:maltose-binding protein MalE
MSTQENEKEKKTKNANANVTRRQALSKMGTAAVGAAAVVVIGGVAYYYMSQAPPGPPSATTTAPVTTAPVTTAPVTTASMTELTSGPPVYFNIWAYHPEIVGANMKIFNEEYNENCDILQVPGDYYASLLTKFMTGPGSRMDMMYLHSDYMTRYYKAGWIQPVNDEEHYNEIRNDYGNKNLLDVLMMPDGNQCGWVYFNGTVPIQYNGKVLQKAGLADDTGHIKSSPKTWDDFVQMCRDVVKSGVVKYAYLPKWIQCGTCGINEIFDEYCISEGELQFDSKTQEPTLENDRVMHILENMRTLVAEKLADPGVLALNEQDHITTMCAGKHAFTETHDYDLVAFNDPTKSPDAGSYHWLPAQPGSKGWYPYMGALYCISSHKYMKRSANEAKRLERLHQFYAWKDKNGNYVAGKQWIQSPPFLGQPYTQYYDDPATKEAWLKQTYDEGDYNVRRNAHLTAVVPPGYHGMVWYSNWHEDLNDYLPKLVLGEVSPQDAMRHIVDTANSLRKEYGGPEIW